MKLYLRTAFLFSLVIFLSHCAGSAGGTGSSVDYSDEIGANGFPTPRALFARYVNALGGETALRSHTSRRQVGTFFFADFGISGQAEVLQAEPNLMLQVIDLSGFGTFNTGYNGQVGWTMDPTSGNVVLQDAMLNDLLSQAEFYLPLTYASIYPQQETVGTAEVNGQVMYQMTLIDRLGKEAQAYFSVETGLLARIDTLFNGVAGPARSITDFLEYREFDGVRVPMHLNLNQAGQEFQLQFETVTFDNARPEEFATPAAIEELL